MLTPVYNPASSPSLQPRLQPQPTTPPPAPVYNPASSPSLQPRLQPQSTTPPPAPVYLPTAVCQSDRWEGRERRTGEGANSPQNVLVIVHLRQIMCYGSVQISVPEEQEAGVRVGSIGSTFPPPYQLLTQVYLRVDQGTGDVYTTDHRMDREALCPDQPQAGECILPHDAIVGPEAELVKFMVVVEDINDHTPHFDNTEIHLSVSEDVAVGTSFLLDDQAEDRDMGRNGQLQYHLEGAGGFFSVTVEEEAAILFLVVRQGLDREKQDLHEMTLVATDCGSTPLSVTATLFIKVTDVNDNCPEFSLDRPQKVVITAESPRDTAVTRVRATDLDLGPNAAITYSLSPKVSERARELFSLDSHTGLISLRGDLRDGHSDSVSVSDRGEEVVLKVLASGPHCPPADTQVTISLLPAPHQENGIKIRFIAEHQNQTIVLQENQPPTVLALLELPGDTSSVRGSSSLSIEGEVPFSLSLQNGKYLLSTSKPLDYEMKSEYHVSVVMRGGVGEPAAQGFPRRVIRVRVVDVNDNAPQFLQSPYLIDIEENNPAGASLLKVRAQDADSSQNGQVTYRLGRPSHTAAAAAIFRIDRNTGQLTVSVPLDREQQDVHRLTVVARDNGAPSLESSVTVTITVLDQNDNAPVFLTPHFIFFIPENIPPLAQVGKVGVSDLDSGLNGELEVRVVNSSVGPFVIDNAQGMLRCMADVDREKQDRYELYLFATDNGRPLPLTSVARVTVFIEDVNDNQPQVILPSSNLSCLAISTGTTTGTMVTKIYAIDEDSGLNSEITYTIAAQEPPGTSPSSHHHGDSSSSPFQLDAQSGNVILAQRLMGKDLGMHHLFIVVSDGGKPAPLHTTVWVNLLVNDTLEPCHLDTMPRSLPYRLAQTPSETPAETPVCDRHAQLIVLLGQGMMAASLCLLLVTVVLYIKHVKENQIPLRIQERYSSGEAF
ncbi:protocadherin-20-like [Coregonus clupeaformis]|uniref:protocadherin-20-like n=1 Tax=Coregonus clupeaformis TaxID=59861 RepID=UPI001E1C55C4|nr:protocadherin-20-like [Coregonus clupeaformis]